MATLAELSANHEQRLARLEEGAEGLKRLAAEQQKMLANLNRRTSNLEKAFESVYELTQRHHDGIDELRAAQVESERRATESEAEWKRWRAESERWHAEWERWAAESERRIATLAESQAHSDRRLDALIDIVRNRLGGEIGT
ncbi:MAG TPA: hypothetical protein VK422_03100 [Pyrinomonadaceae bacterium]|nr:hypothetical protein [Pyrinomonadaceae bacterium]